MTFVVSIASVPVVVIGPPVIPEPLLVPTEVTVPPASMSVSVTDNCPCALILNCFVPGEVGRLPTRRPPSILTPPPTFKVLSGFNVLIPTLLAEVIKKALSLLVCASFKIDIKNSPLLLFNSYILSSAGAVVSTKNILPVAPLTLKVETPLFDIVAWSVFTVVESALNNNLLN